MFLKRHCSLSLPGNVHCTDALLELGIPKFPRAYILVCVCVCLCVNVNVLSILARANFALFLLLLRLYEP